MQQATRLFLFTLGVYFLMVTVADAGTAGTSIEELTGAATSFFEALRDSDFVRWTGLTIFGFIVFGLCLGGLGAAWGTIIFMLLAVAGWVGAEPIFDTLFTSGVVI